MLTSFLRRFLPLAAFFAGSLSVPTLCHGQANLQQAGIPESVVISDYQALIQEVSYQGLPDILTNKQSTDTKQGVALLVARTQLREVPEELLQKLSEQLASNSRNPILKLVTLADLNADSTEARRGGAREGSVLDFSNNQTVLNEAVARGIAMVLFVDLTHFNAKAATVPGAEGVILLNARASLTLLNAADGVRIKSVDRDVKTRGFDERNLTDKAFDLLAKDLSTEATRWKLPELQIKFIQLEVHAKIDGIQFPMMDIDNTGEIQVKEVPVFAQGASVEVDGLLKGQAPCRIDVTPGTHRLKVYRDGTKPFEATVQVSASNRFDALLVPTPEARRQFDAQLAKFEAVKTMALNRNVSLEREGVRTEGMRVNNENARTQGKAVADVIQSRADVARSDADARSRIATGKVAVLQSEADTRRTRADADADVARSDANSRSKIATGKTAVLQSDADTQRTRTDAEADALRTSSTANAEVARSDANSRATVAGGEAAVLRATANNAALVSKVQRDALKSQVDAMKSFAENLAGLGYKLAYRGDR